MMKYKINNFHCFILQNTSNVGEASTSHGTEVQRDREHLDPFVVDMIKSKQLFPGSKIGEKEFTGRILELQALHHWSNRSVNDIFR
jgi:hypothetical protein